MKHVNDVPLEHSQSESHPDQNNVYFLDVSGSDNTGLSQDIMDGIPPGCERVFKRSTYKISMGEAEVWASRKHNSSHVTITVKVAGMLDLRALGLINSIYKFARRYKATQIIIDLARTHHILDSGFSMLILLKNMLGQQIEKIKLVNTRHLKNIHPGYLPVTFEIN